MDMKQRIRDAQLDQAIYESNLREAGLMDPDAPSMAVTNAKWLARMERLEDPFTPAERRRIRLALGLVDVDPDGEGAG